MKATVAPPAGIGQRCRNGIQKTDHASDQGDIEMDRPSTDRLVDYECNDPIVIIAMNRPDKGH